MKLIEKLAQEYAGEPGNPWYDRTPIDKAVYARVAFEAGFRAAREMAAKWLEERTQHDTLFVPGFVPDKIRQLGEDEVQG